MNDGQDKRSSEVKKVKFKLNFFSSGKEYRIWVLAITLSSLFLSAVMSLGSSMIISRVTPAFSVLIILLIIIVNIIFDVVGTSVTAAEEAPFHAMAARKLYAAKEAIRLVRNAEKVSNFCNDVIGDICSVISGTASAYVVYSLFSKAGSGVEGFMAIFIPAAVAGLTVGGKALGKAFAINNSNYIIYKTACLIKFFAGNPAFKRRRNNNRQKEE